MRTNIEIDDRLMRAAMRSSGRRTKAGHSGRGLAPAGSNQGTDWNPPIAGKDSAEREFGRVSTQLAGPKSVDTSVWFDYFAGVSNAETGWLDVEMGKQRLGVNDLILCEILQGTRSDREFRVLKGAMLKYEVFATGSREMAMVSSENYRLLRKQGCTPRKTIDCWIATFCLREGHALLHRDRDFEPFEKYLALRVIHP